MSETSLNPVDPGFLWALSLAFHDRAEYDDAIGSMDGYLICGLYRDRAAGYGHGLINWCEV